MHRFKWMSVLLRDIDGHCLKEPILVDVFRSDYWEVIARDLPVVGVGATPEEAWRAFNRCYGELYGGPSEEEFRSLQELPLQCPPLKKVRKLDAYDDE